MRKFTLAGALRLPLRDNRVLDPKPFPTGRVNGKVVGCPTRIALKVEFTDKGRQPFTYLGKPNVEICRKLSKYNQLAYNWSDFPQNEVKSYEWVEFDRGGAIRMGRFPSFLDGTMWKDLELYRLYYYFWNARDPINTLALPHWVKRITGAGDAVHPVYAINPVLRNVDAEAYREWVRQRRPPAAG